MVFGGKSRRGHASSILNLGLGKRRSFASHHNLSCPFAEGLPIIPAIDSFDTETGSQEEQLKFSRKEYMHIKLRQIAFIFACLKELFMRPDNMLQLLNLIIFAACIEQHSKIVVGCDYFVLQVDM